MAFGVISPTAMLSLGMPPAQASALVHTAEIFTTAGSAASHIWHRNVDWRLVLRLGVAGVLGAVFGAGILSNLDAGGGRPLLPPLLAPAGVFLPFQGRRGGSAPACPAARGPPVWFAGGALGS